MLNLARNPPFIQLIEAGDVRALPEGFLEGVVVEGAAEPSVCGDKVEKFLARNIDASPLAMTLER